MVQARVVQQMIERVDRAGFRVGGAVDDRGDSGLQNGSGTHGARL